MNNSEQILNLVTTLKKDVRASDLVTLNINPKDIRWYLNNLRKHGKLENVGRGLYRLKGADGTSITFELMFGLEIEAEYNMALLKPISKSSYHTRSGCKKFGPKWFVEKDGSLRANHFSNGDTAEFISIPLPKTDVIPTLKKFQNKIWSLAGTQCELKDALNFNDSTGAHIHISLLVHNGKELGYNPVKATWS